MPLTVVPSPPRAVTSWRQPYLFDNVQGSWELNWNDGIKAWTLNLFDSGGNHVAGPLKVTSSSSDLWCAFHHLDSVPPGRLVCQSSEQAPGRFAFQDDTRLVYDNG